MFPSRLWEGLGVGTSSLDGQSCVGHENAHPQPLPQAGGEQNSSYPQTKAACAAASRAIGTRYGEALT